MPVRRERPPRAAPDRAARAHRPGLALLPARRAPRPAVRLPRAWSLQARGGPALQSEQAARRSVREGFRRRAALERRAVRLHRRPQARGPRVRPARQRRLHAQVPRARDRVHLGRRPEPGRALARDRDLRAARARLHHAPPGRACAAARHLRRARHRAGDRAPQAPRRDHRRADAGARLRRRPAPVRHGPAQLLGLQHARLLRPREPLLGLGQGEGVQDHGEDAALGRHRGDPRRGLQPHLRGQPPRAHAVASRHRQPRLLPPRFGQPAPLRRLHRLRQHAQPASTRARCSW